VGPLASLTVWIETPNRAAGIQTMATAPLLCPWLHRRHRSRPQLAPSSSTASYGYKRSAPSWSTPPLLPPPLCSTPLLHVPSPLYSCCHGVAPSTRPGLHPRKLEVLPELCPTPRHRPPSTARSPVSAISAIHGGTIVVAGVFSIHDVVMTGAGEANMSHLLGEGRLKTPSLLEVVRNFSIESSIMAHRGDEAPLRVEPMKAVPK
jgi:hypothetical protein